MGASSGITLEQACCVCSGSSDAGDCVDNMDFTDTFGYTCSQYSNTGYCGMV